MSRGEKLLSTLARGAVPRDRTPRQEPGSPGTRKCPCCIREPASLARPAASRRGISASSVRAAGAGLPGKRRARWESVHLAAAGDLRELRADPDAVQLPPDEGAGRLPAARHPPDLLR